MPNVMNHTPTAAEPPVVIEPRMRNPAAGAPEALEGIQKMRVAIRKGGLGANILALTHMRASQINGCSSCIEGTINHARRAGEPLDERLLAVAAWRESSRFTEPERAALALTEELTRLADREERVPDAVWSAAACHFEERALAALTLHIALTNLFNRVNVATRQPAGEW